MFYTLPEVASILKVSDKTVRKLIREGQLPVVTLGREIRVKESDLQSLSTKPVPPKKAKPLTPAQIAAREKFVKMVRAKSAAKKAAAAKAAAPAPQKNSVPVAAKA